MLKAYKFSAVWCPACLIMNPIWEKINSEFDLKMESFDYDIDTLEVNKYEVGKILPEVIIYKDNKELKRFIGEYSYKKLKEQLEEYK